MWLLVEKREVRSILVLLSMGRLEFPSTPINAPTKVMHLRLSKAAIVQPTLEGIELEQSPEIELGNCIVTTAVKFQKTGEGE